MTRRIFNRVLAAMGIDQASVADIKSDGWGDVAPKLEPEAVALLCSSEETSAYSIAISLKRIADMLARSMPLVDDALFSQQPFGVRQPINMQNPNPGAK